MDFEPNSLTTFLAIVWFIVYWVLGGVFFAVLAILKLGRLKKVRFSCLFTVLAAFCGYVAAFWGTLYGDQAIRVCLQQAQTKAEVITSLFGCGFSAVFGAFLAGAAVLTFGGLVIMSMSKSKSKPWIVLEQTETGQDVEQETPTNAEHEGEKPRMSKFF